MNSVQKNKQGCHSSWPWTQSCYFLRGYWQGLCAETLLIFASLQFQASDSLGEKRQSLLPFRHNSSAL